MSRFVMICGGGGGRGGDAWERHPSPANDAPQRATPANKTNKKGIKAWVRESGGERAAQLRDLAAFGVDHTWVELADKKKLAVCRDRGVVGRIVEVVEGAAVEIPQSGSTGASGPPLPAFVVFEGTGIVAAVTAGGPLPTLLVRTEAGGCIVSRNAARLTFTALTPAKLLLPFEPPGGYQLASSDAAAAAAPTLLPAPISFSVAAGLQRSLAAHASYPFLLLRHIVAKPARTTPDTVILHNGRRLTTTAYVDETASSTRGLPKGFIVLLYPCDKTQQQHPITQCAVPGLKKAASAKGQISASGFEVLGVPVKSPYNVLPKRADRAQHQQDGPPTATLPFAAESSPAQLLDDIRRVAGFDPETLLAPCAVFYTLSGDAGSYTYAIHGWLFACGECDPGFAPRVAAQAASLAQGIAPPRRHFYSRLPSTSHPLAVLLAAFAFFRFLSNRQLRA